MAEKQEDPPIVYEHRVSAVLAAASAASKFSDPEMAAQAYYDTIAAAKRNERDTGWTPPNQG